MPNILVADYKVTIRAYLCAYLRDCGFLAWGVESADNAIRLLDLGRGGRSGFFGYTHARPP